MAVRAASLGGSSHLLEFACASDRRSSKWGRHPRYLSAEVCLSWDSGPEVACSPVQGYSTSGRLLPDAYLPGFVRGHLALRTPPQPEQRSPFPGHSFWKLRPSSFFPSSHHSSPFPHSCSIRPFVVCTQEQA